MPRHETADMRPHVEAVNPMQLGYQTAVPPRVTDSPETRIHTCRRMTHDPEWATPILAPQSSGRERIAARMMSLPNPRLIR